MTEIREQSEANGSGFTSHPFSRFPLYLLFRKLHKRMPLQSGLKKKQIAYLETKTEEKYFSQKTQKSQNNPKPETRNSKLET
ncbi:MAG TPA: hypothetical protein PLL09_04295 [Flavobacterium sp.]|uniref:hypothetical protein n=1 Tax=unclassified Flavobacterium TaxID=196869 RepID=UPI0025BC432D|nr:MULTISPECIES: hypothetical protein [unclassified Flavobacterium]HRE77028.1 hypothetical protein [Flavobacterium sp.]